MKYIIHTFPKRIWYVYNYLVPSMEKQGIDLDNIIVFNDSNERGNLQSFLDSLDYIYNNEKDTKGFWHLQDDVIISKDFKEKTENINEDITYNGFVNNTYAHVKKYGLVKPKEYWYSFPCVYIPNKYINDFMYWIDKIKTREPYKRRYREGRYDDYFYYQFLKLYFPNDKMYNMKPNIVDHIDYLLGGTTGKRKNKPVRSEYFEDLDLVKELEREIKNENKNQKTISKSKNKRKTTRTNTKK